MDATVVLFWAAMAAAVIFVIMAPFFCLGLVFLWCGIHKLTHRDKVPEYKPVEEAESYLGVDQSHTLHIG